MMVLADKRSIIGIDPTSRGLAFVFFEDGRLLDWGTRRDDGNELAVVERLLDRCRADILALEDGDAPGSERRPRVKTLLRAIADYAESRGVEVMRVSRRDVRNAWEKRGVKKRPAVARSIAEFFPEIAPYVPRERMFYHPKEARADLFDAASLVVHAFGVDEVTSGDQREVF